jgi:putative photosynthetic complex assembly protein 2
MLDLVLPVVFAAFIWWFSTGLVLMLDGLPRTTFRWSLAIASAIAVAALGGIAITASDGSVSGAYAAFTCALLVWGWQELSFLTGWLTGPRRHACPPSCSGWRHFVHAIEAILWHELAIIGGAVLIAAITWHGSNAVALWTYAVLWTMRSSAKLNLFFGVRNLSEEFLPPHLTYLKSFFRRRRMNALLPVSVGAAGFVVMLLVQGAIDPAATEPERVGLLLVAALLALAIVEHLMMVLPIDVTALWRWAMRNHAPAAVPSPPPTHRAIAPIELRPAPSPRPD